MGKEEEYVKDKKKEEKQKKAFKEINIFSLVYGV